MACARKSERAGPVGRGISLPAQLSWAPSLSPFKWAAQGRPFKGEISLLSPGHAHHSKKKGGRESLPKKSSQCPGWGSLPVGFLPLTFLWLRHHGQEKGRFTLPRRSIPTFSWPRLATAKRKMEGRPFSGDFSPCFLLAMAHHSQERGNVFLELLHPHLRLPGAAPLNGLHNEAQE